MPCSRILASIPVAVCLAIGAAPARAGSFGIAPVQIFLSERAPTGALTVRNQGDEALRLQLEAFAWAQDSSGAMALTRSGDVVFFPRLLSIAPGEERTIRVATVRPFGTEERAYRLVVQELAPLTRPGEEQRIRMLTRLSLPVFLQPARPVAKAQIERVAVEGHRLRIAVRNLGTVHVQPLGVQLRSGAAGLDAVEVRLAATYVLAGGVRELDVVIPRGQCVPRGAATVDVRTNGVPLRQEVDLTDPLCGG